MIRRVLAALAGALLLLSIAPAAHAAPDPLTCAGYPEPRTFWEGQSWWDQGDGKGMQHLHLGECFPLNQTVSGVIGLDVRLMRHMSLGASADFRIHSDNGKECYRTNPQVPNGDDVTAWLHVNLDTHCFADGYRSIVISWRIQQTNGNRFIVRQSLTLNIQNGTADSNWSPNYILGGAWYREQTPSRDWGYSHGLILGPKKGSSAFSTAPRSGSFSLNVAGGRHPRSSVPTEASFTVTVDPAFHAMPPFEGTVIARKPGGFSGPVAIDTTRFANGLHRLVMIECIEVAAEGKMSCGVINAPLLVANP